MIEIREISKSFNGNPIIRDLSLSVPENSRAWLNNSSGTGKTTLFKMLLGFTPPDKGNIFISGKEITPQNINDLRSKIAYLSQDVDLPPDTGRQVIEEIGNYKSNKGNRHFKALTTHFLGEMAIEETMLSKNVCELSGGERQRLGLAICLALNRPILLLDEPTSALDKKMKEHAVELIMPLKKTILVSSHDPVWAKLGATEIHSFNGNC